jgi:hypothetical protein
MRLAAVAFSALAFAGGAAAALQPGIYDPGRTGCTVARYANGVLHLEKSCATSTNAAAGANITGLTGQPLQSASFTLASTSQCQVSSPRLVVVMTGGTFSLGCGSVQPNGTTYSFGQLPAGTIERVVIMIDAQGSADISRITVNGVPQVPLTAPPTSKEQCKRHGWREFSPPFRNQGECMQAAKHHEHHGHHKH